MADRFRKQIRTALRNEHLQTALDNNALRRMNIRKQSFAAVPDYEERRQRAHRLRAEVVEKLDFYLEQFCNRALQNGMIVHRAADAAEAVQTVLAIARKHQAQLIAKSKSMLSEEIKLNRHLEAAGLEVVETDLGEYIVQLRGEPPAHIITPAVHLRREDVAALFHEKLGMPLTNDIKVMTDLARRTLRDVFLKAEIGISGVNSAVAETGTLCVLTNEGNGRMVTTLPPVHIALMGLERIVPRMDDLALILSLLPRSATGQKITVYANLLHGPRRLGDADGPIERHVILIDNGRSRLRQSPLRESLYCIRCGACLNACPVFREIGGHSYVDRKGDISPYPGPIGSVIAPAYFGMEKYGHLARASTLCGACREVCPVDIDLPKLLLRIRAGLTESWADDSRTKGGSNLPRSPLKEGRGDLLSKPLPMAGNNSLKTSESYVPLFLKIGLGLYVWICVQPGRFQWAQKIAGLLSRLFFPLSDWMHLPHFTRWGFSKDFPQPARRPFRERLHGAPAAVTIAGPCARQDRATVSQSNISAPQSVLLAERFSAELTDLEGVFIACSEKDLAGRLTALLQNRGITELAAWGKQCLPNGLIDALRNSGLLILEQPRANTRAGLTGVLAAIAETGTLVIPAGPAGL